MGSKKRVCRPFFGLERASSTSRQHNDSNYRILITGFCVTLEGPMRAVLLMPSDDATVWVNALNVWGFQTLHTEVSDSATRELLNPDAAPEIGVLDYRCFGDEDAPLLNNLETTLHQLRSGIASAHQYLIVLSPDIDSQLLLLNAGADVVVQTPFTAATLRVHMEVARRMLSIQVRERDQRERDWEAQNQDHLSGVLNKTAILRKLEQLSVQCQDRNQSIGLLLAQIYVREDAESSGTQEHDSADHLNSAFTTCCAKNFLVFTLGRCAGTLWSRYFSRHCSRLWRGRAVARGGSRFVVTFSAPMLRFLGPSEQIFDGREILFPIR